MINGISNLGSNYSKRTILTAFENSYARPNNKSIVSPVITF